MSTLNFITSVVAYNDTSINSNPIRCPINWARTITGRQVFVPATNIYWVPPLSSTVIFDGSRTTSIDGTSAFSLTINNQDPTRYRITNTGGTAPGFRTARALTLSTVPLTLVILSNLSMTVTAGSGTPFSSVVVGDEVFIPGVATGDSASPFNNLNVGIWTVLTQSNTVLTLARAPGSVFSGASEVVTPSTNTQFVAFSAAGVQVSDMVDINAGFSTANQGIFEVLAVTATWIEILSTLPLGPQAGISPNNAGMMFYSSAKDFLYIEIDQNCIVRFNGSTDSTNRVNPLIPGDQNNVGHLAKDGPTWRCEIVNKSTATLQATVLSAE